MTNYEFARSMDMNNFVAMITRLVCNSHDDLSSCLKCSHWDKTYGGCKAFDNIKGWLESEVKDNDKI